MARWFGSGLWSFRRISQRCRYDRWKRNCIRPWLKYCPEVAKLGSRARPSIGIASAGSSKWSSAGTNNVSKVQKQRQRTFTSNSCARERRRSETRAQRFSLVDNCPSKGEITPTLVSASTKPRGNLILHNARPSSWSVLREMYVGFIHITIARLEN